MIQDWRGNEIVVGSTIIYPGRYSSSLYMVEAYVMEVGEKKKYSWREDLIPYIKAKPLLQKSHGRPRTREDKEVTLTRVDLVTVIE